MAREKGTEKPERKMIADMIFQINLALSTNSVPEHIRMDEARITPNGKWNVFPKLRANTKMLMFPNTKTIILTAAHAIDRHIIDIQEVTPWPQLKIHQISLDEHMPFRTNKTLNQEQRYTASTATLKRIQTQIESEYNIHIHNTRWIRSINWCMDTAEFKYSGKIYTSIVIQMQENSAEVTG
jgi:hypothetical protein